MLSTTTGERRTYAEWQALGRQVLRGARRGVDGRFGIEQTKLGGRRSPRVCATCGCRINYGMYCGKCEFGGR